jgi:hypothetical protein
MLSPLNAVVARLEKWLSERNAERSAVAEYRTAWRRLHRLRRNQMENGRSALELRMSHSNPRSNERHD